jgi:hypothetical protein
MTEGAWIFLSHSHKDFDRVSSVRNVLEGHGHHPLMFFLKCLGDDDEIDGLIRREISARSWFILCESANTKISKWVQAEVQIIKGLPIKTYTEIDLDDPHLDVESELFSITRKASVFLSYARSDRVFAERMGAELKRHDFGVFSDLELQVGEDWRVRMESELENAALRGAILMLLSAESVRSQWQQRDVAFAVEIARSQARRAHMLPVFLEGFDFAYAPQAMRRQLMQIQGINFSRGEFEENMAILMAALRQFEWRA